MEAVRGGTVVIVDDDSGTRAAYVEIFETLGYGTVAVGTVAEGFEQLKVARLWVQG